MSEKPPLRPLLEDGGENFVHPTAPPSYDEATIGFNRGNQSSNHPGNPYQGYPGQVMPNSSVPQHAHSGMPVYPTQPGNAPYPTVSQGMPSYPNQPGNVPYPAAPQPVAYGVYPNLVVNAPNLPPPTATTNITVPVTRIVPVGPRGQRMRCVHCGADIKSTTITSYKATAHLACLILCIFFCCLCAWLPYCMSSCKKVDHKCPNCKGHLGTYND